MAGLVGVVAVGVCAEGWWQRANVATLQITSAPPGATVTVDGVFFGVTPAVAGPLAPGAHSLRLTKRGIAPHSEGVEVRRGENRRHVDLKPEARFRLRIACRPSKADVYLNGEVIAHGTPVEVPDLAPGGYEVRLAAEGHIPFQQQIEVGPGHPDTLRASLQSKTETYYLDAVQRNPQVISNYTELAHHYVIANEFEKAGEVLKKALALSGEKTAKPGDVSRLHQEIHTIYYGTFDFGGKEAVAQARPAIEKALRETLQSRPAEPAPYVLLGGMLAATGQLAGAEEVFREGVKNLPDHPQLPMALAKTLQRQGKFAEAATVLDKIVQARKTDVAARNLLAEVYQQLGKTDAAIQHREQVAALGKSNTGAAIGALISLAGLYHRKGDFCAAGARWEAAADLQKDPRLRAQYRVSAGMEYAQGGDIARAVAVWREVAKTCPDKGLKDQAEELVRKTTKK